MKTMMKKMTIWAVCLFLVCGAALADVSGISDVLSQFDYPALPDKDVKEMQCDLPPMEFDGGEVRYVETLVRDGWLLTTAHILCTDENTLVMPGSLSWDDRVSDAAPDIQDADDRTFLEYAREKGKKLLAVYAYPTEFDETDSYFLHQTRLADGSWLFTSGAQIPVKKGVTEVHLGVSVYEIDLETALLTLLETTELLTPV